MVRGPVGYSGKKSCRLGTGSSSFVTLAKEDEVLIYEWPTPQVSHVKSQMTRGVLRLRNVEPASWSGLSSTRLSLC